MRTERRDKKCDLRQFDLFGVSDPTRNVVVLASVEKRKSSQAAQPHHAGSGQATTLTIASPATPIVKKPAAAPKTQNVAQNDNIRIVAKADLPTYSDAEIAIVEQTMAAVPASKVWFTYADIRQAFTISRATVVRRSKAGCIPGIRFLGDRVLEDGAIRRFTRDQVRYLLLAIRRG